MAANLAAQAAKLGAIKNQITNIDITQKQLTGDQTQLDEMTADLAKAKQARDALKPGDAGYAEKYDSASANIKFIQDRINIQVGKVQAAKAILAQQQASLTQLRKDLDDLVSGYEWLEQMLAELRRHRQSFMIIDRAEKATTSSQGGDTAAPLA